MWSYEDTEHHLENYDNSRLKLFGGEWVFMFICLLIRRTQSWTQYSNSIKIHGTFFHFISPKSHTATGILILWWVALEVGHLWEKKQKKRCNHPNELSAAFFSSFPGGQMCRRGSVRTASVQGKVCLVRMHHICPVFCLFFFLALLWLIASALSPQGWLRY